MAEPVGSSITGGPTPEPPQGPGDMVGKLKREGKDRSLGENLKTAASGLDREVSGEYEAKQEREAGQGGEPAGEGR